MNKERIWFDFAYKKKFCTQSDSRMEFIIYKFHEGKNGKFARFLFSILRLAYIHIFILHIFIIQVNWRVVWWFFCSLRVRGEMINHWLSTDPFLLRSSPRRVLCSRWPWPTRCFIINISIKSIIHFTSVYLIGRVQSCWSEMEELP